MGGGGIFQGQDNDNCDERTSLVRVKSVRMVVIPIAGVNEEERESMSGWRQCCRKEERCYPEDQPRYGVLSEGL